jgi:oxygen-dependent protoporphyrinogen oxidase
MHQLAPYDAAQEQALPDALHARHREHIRLGQAVRALRRENGAYVLECDSGDVRADRVVFTGAARATASLLQTIDPAAARSLTALHYNPLGIVHLHTTAAVRRALGYQVAFGEQLCTRGVTFNDALFGRAGVYTAYLGGAQHAEVADWPDDRVAAVAVSEFEAVTGAQSRALSVVRVLMPAWDRSWAALSELRAPPGTHFLTNWSSRPGLPGRLSAARSLAADLSR